MSQDNPVFKNNSPLQFDQIRRIEEVNLSTLDKHYLRLLAHCLASFKAMNANPSNASLPNKYEQMQWCLQQPSLSEDKEFIELLLNQFSAAVIQLERIAESLKVQPLDLTLEDLINDASEFCSNNDS